MLPGYTFFVSYCETELGFPSEDHFLYFKLFDHHTIGVRLIHKGKATDLGIHTAKGNYVKDLLLTFLTDFISYPSNFWGDPFFNHGTLITEAEFKRCKSKAIKIIDRRKAEAVAAKGPLVQLCEQLGLHPRPEGSAPHRWYANCPSGRNLHFLLVSNDSNMWGCGYCSRKGSLEELSAWVEEVKQQTGKS